MRWLASFLLAGAFCGLIACGGPEPAKVQSPGAPVVLISIDTLRSDRLPMYGYEGVETPALDAFRQDAILFERAYAHYPLTFPSHVSLLTGQLPTENGVRDNAGYRVPDDYRPYLPRLLQDAGYATGATVSSFVLRSEAGLGQGFDYYDDRMEVHETADLFGPERFGAATLAAARSWLDGVFERPFFLFFHLYEPHIPWNPPEPFLSRWGKTYEGEIAAADALVGGLLEDLRERGVYDRALIIVLSDHGEGLMTHDEEGHGIFLYREAIQVPLLVKLPGQEHAGATVATPAGLIDVLPTIVEVLGLEVPEAASGGSLLELLGDDAPSREVFSETMYPLLHYGWSDLSSLISEKYHYIEGPDPELYDLEADPGETIDVRSEQRAVLADLRARIRSYHAPLELPSEEDPEVAEKLAALGYLSGSSTTLTEGELADPKERMARMVGKLNEAFADFGEGDYEGAIRIFQELLESNPKMTDAWEHIGICFQELGRFEEALEAFRKAIELTRGSAQSTFFAGRVLVELGRLDEARQHAEHVAALSPRLARELGLEIALASADLATALQIANGPGGEETGADVRRRLGLALSAAGRQGQALALLRPLAGKTESPAVLVALALVEADTGQFDEALKLVAQVLETDPENALAWETRGLVALRQGRVAEAKADLEKALGYRDELANSWNLLGVARFQSGEVQGALDAWERAVSLDPGLLDALFNLGLTSARVGRTATARRALNRYIAVAPAERFARELAQVREILGRMGATP